jgi:hypothetical protein
VSRAVAAIGILCVAAALTIIWVSRRPRWPLR